MLAQGLQERAQPAYRILLREGEVEALPVRPPHVLLASSLPAGLAKSWVAVSDKTVTEWYSYCRNICSKEMLARPMQVRFCFSKPVLLKLIILF